MNAAYVDSSVLVALAFGESGGATANRRLKAFETVWSAPLLDAEVRSAFKREGRMVDVGLLDAVRWVLPRRPLSLEIERVLDAGYVRGADCWHLASALYLAVNPGEVVFLTLDLQQRKVATALGFKT